ncbi:VOC family protein [Pyxidicoccus fallax]|uniref:VOC family protein n=1 Tax=Pyxidicoccus fallax TaxID=394095 RepID=A0A848L8K2_9BACT|nr:VOC family protein [Pyxidicoccus fallax]NMO14887.1 VOC family protein [Pyxidicoccus fallax]NPC77812.1 VOC family protein [Pyxidicoccus fallax]
MTTTHTFVSYDLRTTDLDAAEAFYTGLMGWQVQRSGESRVFLAGTQPVGLLMALPERARAQGAPAHWLGHIGVEDVDAMARRFVERGGQMLGPVQQPVPGQRVAILKDSQGAVFSMSTRRSGGSPGAIAWHELNTTDREQAWAAYSELFGWRATGKLELGPQLGTYQMFTWEGAGRDVGAMVNTARLPSIHTHWLFYLTVPDLDAALQRLRALGGRVLNGPMQVPSGDRVAQCEDPQGAAFALRQSVRTV